MMRIRVGVAGCGSVSGPYLENLKGSRLVTLVSLCDPILERADRRGDQFGVPHRFDDLDAMLSGPDFDFLINLTSMGAHYDVNRRALLAGRHVYCEKPIAGNLEEGRDLLELADRHGLRLYGAPNVVTSPAFRRMTRAVISGEIGRVHAARGCYGHSGPEWGPWFYRKGGGSLFDLGVYNITTLTGLLGPARKVTALIGTAIPERVIEGERVIVEADDNAMVLMDHGGAVFSSAQTGFVYRVQRDDTTIELIGTEGGAALAGYDWEPRGVRLWTRDRGEWETVAENQEGYGWETGGSAIAECIASGTESPMTAAHAFHVLEVMLAALESGRSGRAVPIESTFPWPITGG